MDSLLDLLYAPIQPFVWHEERAFIVAFVFAGLIVFRTIANKEKFTLRSIWPLLLALVAWILFGINEYIAHSNKANIRIDLLFFGPVMMAISLYAMYSFVKGLISRS